jgi:hypothetical protein
LLFKLTENIVPKIMTVVDPKFDQLKITSKKEYYSRVVSNFHAIVAVIMSSYGVWFACGNGETIFSSDVCLVTP